MRDPQQLSRIHKSSRPGSRVLVNFPAEKMVSNAPSEKVSVEPGLAPATKLTLGLINILRRTEYEAGSHQSLMPQWEDLRLLLTQTTMLADLFGGWLFFLSDFRWELHERLILEAESVVLLRM